MVAQVAGDPGEPGDHQGARHLLTFAGFDYQDPREARLAGFAELLISEGRWAGMAHHFGDDPNEPHCPNSHHQVVALYQRMVRAYKQILNDRKAAGQVRGADGRGFLDGDELKKVFAATRHSDLPEW